MSGWRARLALAGLPRRGQRAQGKAAVPRPRAAPPVRPGAMRVAATGLALAAGIAGIAGTASIAVGAPIRTSTPGTGVVQGIGATGRFTLAAEEGDREDLRESVGSTRILYTPSTHWLLAVEVPYVERTITLRGPRAAPGLAKEHRASGLGDVALSGKFRFYRRVGRWGDRHAAVEARVELPTGESDLPADPRLPLPLQRGLQPGSGSTDLTVDLVYQQARGRFVRAADLAWRENGDGPGGYRQGRELRLNLDAEYILLPRIYVEPGRELFALLEATIVHREADRARGTPFPETSRDEVLLAPGLEYVATERLFLALSVQLPVHANAEAGGRTSDWNVLAEARFSF